MNKLTRENTYFLTTQCQPVAPLKYIVLKNVKFLIIYKKKVGTEAAQWLRCCATNRKVVGSIPDGVMEFFIDIILPIALWLWGRRSL